MALPEARECKECDGELGCELWWLWPRRRQVQRRPELATTELWPRGHARLGEKGEATRRLTAVRLKKTASPGAA